MFRFRECREAAGISQKAAAITVGVKPPSMSDWESGRTNPTCDKLVKLAELYGVTVDELLGISTKKSPDKNERRMMNAFRQLNAGAQAVLISTAETMLTQADMRQEAITASAV